MIRVGVASNSAMFERFTIGVLRLAVPACAAIVVLAMPLAASAQDESDPWENMNRGTFAFNEGFDTWVLIPVANAWDFVAPEPVQTGLDNVFKNAAMVIVMGNDLLQLKPRRAIEDLGRLVTNTTVGIGGIFDVATQVGIPQNDEDFGQTLGYWGVPAGPYLVLPILGPSNSRDTFGFAVDTFSQPWAWFVPLYASVPVAMFEYLNLRTIYLEEIDELHETALDYYVFQRNAYAQDRANAVNDTEGVESEQAEDLYYFDEEE